MTHSPTLLRTWDNVRTAIIEENEKPADRNQQVEYVDFTTVFDPVYVTRIVTGTVQGID